MRGLKMAGLAVALLASTSANAATYFATISGVVTGTSNGWFTDPAATSPIRIGDTITATFRFTSATPPSGRFSMLGANQATFRLGDFTWTSDADHLGELAPPQFQAGADPLGAYVSIMEGSSAGGDLRVRRYTFDIGEFGYGFYRGPGFTGTFDPASLVTGEGAPPQLSSAVPELTLWAQLIAGFGVVGAAIRQRSARRAKWRGLVSKLSGRVREA